MAELRDAEVVLTAEERADVADLMDRAERLLDEGADKIEYRSVLRALVDALSDLQIGSETSDFVFPLGDVA